MNPSNGKTALVTGASRGIGAAVAKRLGEDGFAVVVNYAGGREAATAAAKAISDNGGRAVAVQGRIVNFSSSVIGLQLPGYAAYVATKAGVEALTTILAKELRGREITVNSVAPGPTATDLFLKGKSDELIAKMSKQPPLERIGQPGDIARVVAFLVSEQGGWVNGQTVRANGGIV